MSDVCLRCDWQGTGGRTCPRCGAPLFHPVAPSEPRRAAAPRTDDRTPVPAAPPDREASVGVVARAPTSVRAAAAVAAVAFAVIVLAVGRGGVAPDQPPTPAAPSTLDGSSTGILVYAVADGSGAARLWLWDLADGDVRQGPLIREPLELVNVRSPGYGWIAFTADLGNGIVEAAVLDSLARDARPDPVGRADAVSWAREGGTAVLVRREPVLDGCRRHVVVETVNLDVGGGETVFDETFCGDVLSVGRTTLGYVLTEQRRDGVDIVGTGYHDAGVLLADHGLIAISPGGDMLVTPSSGFVREEGGRPVAVAGEASAFTAFGGRPAPYVVDGAPLTIERVLAYSPGSTHALAIGRLPAEEAAIWTVPFGIAGDRSVPRPLGSADGFTSAAYAADGTGFVLTGGRLWALRERRLEPVDLPDGAPTPNGPLVWIVREPLTEL